MAQQRPPGGLDASCLNDCAAQGYDPEHCNKICWVADPSAVRPGEVTDWVCMTECANRGGKYSDCKQRCRLR